MLPAKLSKAPGIPMAGERRARECLDPGARFVAVALNALLPRDSLDVAAARFRDKVLAAAKPAATGNY